MSQEHLTYIQNLCNEVLEHAQNAKAWANTGNAQNAESAIKSIARMIEVYIYPSQKCSVCGCTEYFPCVDEECETCHWVHDDIADEQPLCSHCQEKGGAI